MRAADVTILRRPVPVALDGPVAKGLTWQMNADQFLLTVPAIARFHLSGDDTIAAAPEAGGDAADIPAFLLGAAIPIMLQRRGQIVLRASAVAVNGKAVLICGASGHGKSTLAAALAQRGHRLLADDTCTIVQTTDELATVHGDGGGLKLWAQAIERLALVHRRGPPLRGKIEKYHVTLPAPAADALPLGAVYTLREARPPHAPGIERPNVVDAALILRRSAYHPALIEPLGQRPLYFRAATVGNHVGIYIFTFMHGFDHLPAMVEMLERHLLTTAAMERAA
jgi:hypothetical protein